MQTVHEPQRSFEQIQQLENNESTLSHCQEDILIHALNTRTGLSYHKVKLNSDNKILHVKFSSPTR